MPLKKKTYSKSEGIYKRVYFISLVKELFRKSIHICSAFIPLLLKYFYGFTIFLLVFALIVYSICEFLRLKGKTVPVISAITASAARKRDENKFVLGPITLVIGILCSAIFFDPLPARIGIYALAFGDGLASLTGKAIGRVIIPCTMGKTVAGSLMCFAAIFISSFCSLNQMPVDFLSFSKTLAALILASIGMIIELLPLKDFDNILIPIVISFSASILTMC